MMDASLTLIDPARDKSIDVGLFADPGRHFKFRDAAIAQRMLQAAKQEAPRTIFDVGGGSARHMEEFYDFDLRRNKELMREVSRVVDSAFVDASAEVVKQMIGHRTGLLSEESGVAMEALASLIELRQFMLNAVALGGKRRMLFRAEHRDVQVRTAAE